MTERYEEKDVLSRDNLRIMKNNTLYDDIDGQCIEFFKQRV